MFNPDRLSGIAKLAIINGLIGDVGVITNYLEHYSNLSLFIKGRDEIYTIAITAHHDVVNKESENCLDNSASLLNLAKICNKLKETQPKYNVLCAWVDAEELCDPSINGVNHLRCKVDYLIDLELTASGTIVAINPYGGAFGQTEDEHRTLLDGMLSVSMPYNCAHASYLLANTRGSACVALISEADAKQIANTGYCDRWAQCHQQTDTFNTWYSSTESEAFVNFIVEKLI